MIKSSGLVSVQNSGEDHVPENHASGFYGKAVIIEDPMWERSVRTMSGFDPVVKGSLTGDIIRVDAALVGKITDIFYRLFVDVYADVRCCWTRIFVFYIELHPKVFASIVLQVCRSQEVNGSTVYRCSRRNF